jgi:type IV secretory pathway VirB3-like protein
LTTFKMALIFIIKGLMVRLQDINLSKTLIYMAVVEFDYFHSNDISIAYGLLQQNMRNFQIICFSFSIHWGWYMVISVQQVWHISFLVQHVLFFSLRFNVLANFYCLVFMFCVHYFFVIMLFVHYLSFLKELRVSEISTKWDKRLCAWGIFWKGASVRVLQNKH